MAKPCKGTMQATSCLTCTDRHADWFCDLSPGAMAEYDAMGVHLTAPTGSLLFREGQPARNVHLLCSGHVKLTASSKEGRTLLVRIARPGDVLGLSAAMSGTPYETTAQALEPVQIKSFQQKDFLCFIERHIEGSMHAAQMLNREYRDALSDATRMALSNSIAGRVSRLLLEMASGHDESMPRLKISLTHEELAAMLGTSRESVTRILSELKRKDIIAVRGTSVTILRKDALELLA